MTTPIRVAIAILALGAVGLIVSCGDGDSGVVGSSSATSSPSTPIHPEARRVVDLIPAATVRLRVDYVLTSPQAGSGQLVWRQRLGVRRLDFEINARTPYGGFEIQSNFGSDSIAREGAACNWTAIDDDTLRVNCGGPLDVGTPGDEVRAMLAFGILDRNLPSRDLMGMALQCFAIRKTGLSSGGEICVEPSKKIPLYYSGQSGTSLTATSYSQDLTPSSFSPDLVDRLSRLTSQVVAKSDIEFP